MLSPEIWYRFTRNESFDSVESSHVVFLSLIGHITYKELDLLALSKNHSELAILAVIYDITCHKIY